MVKLGPNIKKKSKKRQPIKTHSSVSTTSTTSNVSLSITKNSKKRKRQKQSSSTSSSSLSSNKSSNRKKKITRREGRRERRIRTNNNPFRSIKRRKPEKKENVGHAFIPQKHKSSSSHKNFPSISSDGSSIQTLSSR